MKKFPQDFEDSDGIWVPKGVTDSIAYSDGKGVEDYLRQTIEKANDISSTSMELQTSIRDWPSRYHLSPTRGSLFRALSMRSGSRILELGSGCGAITRYLGEQDVVVTAVEGSHERARITRARCRELDNVNVVSGNFDDLSFDNRFDIVTLIGVLEYSHLFCRAGEADPFSYVLRAAWNHLEDDGVLVIAIENKLGIKYLAGCGEDHFGTKFVGVEGYPDDEGARTFGKQELLDLVEQCGFEDFELLLPFPDYKLPTTLINAKSCSSKDAQRYNIADWCRQNYEDYVNPRAHIFQEHLVLNSMAENGLISDFANSFLLIASKKPLTEKSPILPIKWCAKRINVARESVFQTVTTLKEGPKGSFVTKEGVVKSLNRSKEEVTLILSEQERYVENGRSLSLEFLRAIRGTRNPKGKYLSSVVSWIEFLQGEAEQTEVGAMLPGHFLDCIPENLIRDSSGKLNYIDTEWHWHEPITMDWVIFRGLYVFWLHYRLWIEKTIVMGAYSFKGFVDLSLEQTEVRLSIKQLEAAGELEHRFQSAVSGRESGNYFSNLLRQLFNSKGEISTPKYKPSTFISKKSNHSNQLLVKDQNKTQITQKTKLRVAVLSFDSIIHACAYIRIQSIFQSLGADVTYRQVVNFKDKKYIIDKPVINWADVIIIQRVAPRENSQALMDEVFASGCCVIYETDDLFTEKLPESNFLARAFEEHIPYIIDVAKRVDLITTSTSFLAKKLSQYNANVQVLPNLLDQNLWLKKSPVIAKKIQNIVFAGTQTHAADLECIENALLKIYEKYQGSIKFTFLGCSTPNLRKLPGTEYYDLVPYREFSTLLQKISVDIAIIPLLDGQFNDCKSNIKWLEYSMCGIAGVYSNVLPYQCIQDSKTGLLVNNNEDDWFKALEWLINNPEKRVEIALAAQRQVIEKYTLATESIRYYQTWLSLRNSKLQKLEQRLTTSSPEIGNTQLTDQDYLQELSYASGLEAASQVLLTISEIMGSSIFNTAIIASSADSKFLSKFAVTKDELFLKLAEVIKDKAIEKAEHDNGLLCQVLQFLNAIDHQSVYFEKSFPLKTSAKQLLYDLEYQSWIINHGLLEVDAELFAERMMLKWKTKPSFHLLMLLFPQEQALLADTLDSLGKQFYREWGLTVVSELPVPDPLFDQEDFLNWVQVKGNDDPYELLNALISDVESDWVGIIEPGSTFEQQTFIQLADYINIKPKWKLIYTDEDILETDETGNIVRTAAKFKPDFNLDLLRSTPFIGKFCVVERASLLEMGGVLAEFGLENYAATFRCYDNYGDQAIGHISDVLFHQPAISNRQVTDEQIQNIVKRHLQRNSIHADVEAGYLPQSCRVIYQHHQQPKVSIIIPTKDKLEYLEPCIESLLEKTEYPNYEVIIVDNKSSDPDVFEYYSSLKQKYLEKIKVIDYPHAFNFSAICNYAADQAEGKYLLLLNNDTEVLHKEWLERMMMHAMREDVGIVGARLVYPETGLLQHAGVVMGMDTIADHPFIGQLHIKEAGYMGRALLDQNYSAVTGACLLIEKNIYQLVNGMDEENFAVSYNDVDLCLKIREAGYRVIWTPYSTLIHHGNVTQNSTAVSKEKIERFNRERKAMFKKWQPIIMDDPAYNRQLSLAKRDFSVEAVMPSNWDVNFHDRMRIFGVPLEGGAGDYRIIQPFNALRKAGFAQCEYLRLQDNTKDRISVSEIARQQPDVLVLHSSVTDKNLELLEQCKTLLPEVFLIYMIDDLFDQVPEKSSAYRTIKRSFRDAKPRIRRALSLCDRAIVSTKPLAKFCRSMKDDIKIVPNSLESDVWCGLESKRRQGNKLRVGWAGAMQHQGDLEMIAEVVKQTASEVDWVFMGMCPESIKPNIKEFQEGVHISDYPEVLAGLNLDLAIAPLEDNNFNEAKSNLRLLEYGILGWPVICSDVYPYRGAPVTCVENTTESWLAAIRQAINYQDNLPKQGDTLCQWVTTNYLLEDNLDRWLEALKPKS